MSNVLNTSTMKSPPLEVWLTGSRSGGRVSTAIWIGPGAAAFMAARGALTGTLTWASAAAGVSAAALARVAPLRNLRRSGSGNGRRFDMYFLPNGRLRTRIDSRNSSSNAILASWQFRVKAGGTGVS